MTAPLASTFHLSEQRVGPRAVLAVEGELDMVTAPELRVAAGSMTRAAFQELWIDLSGVTFLDSAGVHAAMDIDRALRNEGRRLSVICPPGPARRTLSLTGVDEALRIFVSARDAHGDG
jgi:anti-sigma B factor antagonist